MIHLKEDDDQRTVVTIRKRNSCRYNSQDEESDGDVPDRITLDSSTKVKSENGSHVENGKPKCISNTLPGKLEKGKDWDDLDELLQVERVVDPTQKPFQTLSGPITSRSDSGLSNSIFYQLCLKLKLLRFEFKRKDDNRRLEQFRHAVIRINRH